MAVATPAHLKIKRTSRNIIGPDGKHRSVVQLATGTGATGIVIAVGTEESLPNPAERIWGYIYGGPHSEGISIGLTLAEATANCISVLRRIASP